MNEQRLDAIDSELALLMEGIEAAPDISAQPLWWSTTNAMTMSAAVLVFGLFVIFAASYLIQHGQTGQAILRIFGTIMILISALFLVVAGYDDTQIAPVLGLLGTIAGYLLGKDDVAGRSQPGGGDEATPTPAPTTGGGASP